MTRPKPENGLGGELVDFAAKQALQKLFGGEPTGQAIKVLRDELIRLYNDAPRGTQYAVIGAVGVGVLAHTITNIDEVLEQLGNATYDIRVPVQVLGIEGVKLTMQVALDDFNPRLSQVVLQLSNVLSGTLTVKHNLDRNATDLGWTLIEGTHVFRVNVGGLGTANPSVGANLKITF